MPATETFESVLEMLCCYSEPFNITRPCAFNRNSLFVQEGTRLRPSSVGHLVDHVIHASPSLPVFSSNHKSASSTQANSISLDSTP